jgi:nitrate reductase assembly molybdenum cofactor insertion protein NarJ
MVTVPGPCELLGRLLRYPGPDYVVSFAKVSLLLADMAPETAALIRGFGARLGALTMEEHQELYTRTFELSPACALEVGWQLYGEEYARGSFLVFLRDNLRRHGIAEEIELPDHLMHVLPLLERLGSAEAKELTEGAVLPAIEKMLNGLAGKNNPYESLLRVIREFLAGRIMPELAETSHA